LTFRISNRNLYVGIPSPRGDFTRLLLHFVEVIGKNFERNRPITDGREGFAGKFFVTRDPSFAHQRRVRRETLDNGVLGHTDDVVETGGVAKKLDPEGVEG